MSKDSKYLVFNRTVLQVAALVTMLIDHIGVMFVADPGLYEVFRIIGRIAFVIFALFISEGVFYTKRPLKYALRLFILYFVTQIVIVINFYIDGGPFFYSNIFLTLLSSAALLIYFHHKLYKHVYLLIPFLAHATLTTLALIYPNNNNILMFTGDYMIYRTLLIVGFYLSSLVAKQMTIYQARKYQIPEDMYLDSIVLQFNKNIAWCIFLLLLSVIWYVLGRWTAYTGVDPITQTYALLALPFLFLYNGKKGYDAKWWRITYYLFYPVHLIVLAVIYILIYLI